MSPQKRIGLFDSLVSAIGRLETNDKIGDVLELLFKQAVDNIENAFVNEMHLALAHKGAHYGHLLIQKDDELVIKYSNDPKYSNSQHVSPKVMKINDSLCGEAFELGKFRAINDVRIYQGKYHELHNDTLSELAIPIKDSYNKKIFGILNIEWQVENGPTVENIEFFEVLTKKLGAAFEEAKLWEGVKYISEVSSIILGKKHSVEKVYENLLDKILNLLNFRFGQILLRSGTDMVIVSSSDERHINVVAPKNKSLVGFYFFEKDNLAPLIIDKIWESEYKDKYYSLLGSEDRKMHSEIVVPLITENKELLGAINIEDPRKKAFSAFDEKMISIFAELITKSILLAEETSKDNYTKRVEAFQSFNSDKHEFLFETRHRIVNKISSIIPRLETSINSLKSLKEGDKLPTFYIEKGRIEVTIDEYLEKILESAQVANREAKFLMRVHLKNFKISEQDLKSEQVELLNLVDSAIIDHENKQNGHNTIKYRRIYDDLIKERENIFLNVSPSIKVVLNTILDNAVDAMSDGGTITIKLSFKDFSNVQICIIDEGTGMDEDTLSKIFDVGFSTKEKDYHLSDSSKSGGSGYGLSWVRRYLTLYNCEIEVESELGKGSRFNIIVPIKFVHK